MAVCGLIASRRPRCSAAFHCCVDRAWGLALAPPAVPCGFLALFVVPAAAFSAPLAPLAPGSDSSSSTVVGELLDRFKALSSDADESPELDALRSVDCRRPRSSDPRFLLPPPFPPPAVAACVSAGVVCCRMIFRTACCHSVRIDCFTNGYLTTSTTPTLIASIMYVLDATSSSSCISTMATSFAMVVNRPNSGDEFVPFMTSLMIGATCSSSTSATSKWALTSELPCADSRTFRPLSRVFAHVTLYPISWSSFLIGACLDSSFTTTRTLSPSGNFGRVARMRSWVDALGCIAPACMFRGEGPLRIPPKCSLRFRGKWKMRERTSGASVAPSSGPCSVGRNRDRSDPPRERVVVGNAANRPLRRSRVRPGC
mmetsp:Transcript_9010/g.40577  ORF Transcript_9010/g.40577 Transcript_9010/m.40577 type:complete len:371 (-) Transcript_9010:13-1125(-)